MPVDEIEFEAEEKMEKAVTHLKEELRGVRTGRATPALVEYLKVEAYGAPTDLRSLANITAPEANLIVIKPFDPSVGKDIEKAIVASDLGLNPQSDGRVIRLQVPSLSGERRKQLGQQVRTLAEQAKVSIRNIRREANRQIDKEEKDSQISEDDASRSRDNIQEMTKKFETQVAEMSESKTKEIESF